MKKYCLLSLILSGLMLFSACSSDLMTETLREAYGDEFADIYEESLEQNKEDLDTLKDDWNDVKDAFGDELDSMIDENLESNEEKEAAKNIADSFVSFISSLFYEGEMTLAELEEKFPDGKYWNHAGSPGTSLSLNNEDGWTDTPCSAHGVVGTSAQECNDFTAGTNSKYSQQCMGFAEKLGYDFTGINPRATDSSQEKTWITYTASVSYSAAQEALKNVKPGDIIRYSTSGAHSIFVIAVDGDTITYADCNSGIKPYDKRCQIHWGATTTKSELASKLIHIRVAPFEAK